jgi:chromosome partitioning protein
MLSIALVCQKGGTGKTTGAVILAAYAAGVLRQRTWIIDMDPQSSAWRWAETRGEMHPEAARVRCVSAPARTAFRAALESAKRDGAEAVIIDTPAATGDDHFAAIAGAHLVLVPLIPAFFDANASLFTLERAAKERKPAVVLFTQVSDAGAVETTQRAMIAAAAEMSIPPPVFAPLAISQLAEYRSAAAEGLSPAETSPGSKAGREAKAFGRWAFETAAAARDAARPQTTITTLDAARARAASLKGSS